MNEKFANIWNSQKRTPVLVGVLMFGIGSGVGYIVGRYTKKEKYSSDQRSEIRIIKKEIEDELDGYEVGYQKIDEPRVVIETKPKPKIVNNYSLDELIGSPSKLPEVEDLVTRSVFDTDDNWNYEIEEEKRKHNPDGPYVIHKDEFYMNERDLSQITLTYYAGDDIMVDEDTKPVYNYADVTGPMLFGHGSGNPSTFYVRNMKRKCEYEICQDPGLYSVAVLGLQIEDNTRVRDLKHARAPGKFRDD